MAAQPLPAFVRSDGLEGPADRVLAYDLLHAQQLRQHAIVTQRRDVGVALVPARTESIVVPSTSRFSGAFGLV